MAVVTVLTSSIVPHHHHGNEVRIAISHCNCHHNEDKDTAGSVCDCRHDDNDREEKPFDDNGCVAKTSYVTSDQSELRYKTRTGDEYRHNIHFIPVFLHPVDLYSTEAKYVCPTKYRYKTGDFLNKSEYVNRINGLRAPPCSIA
ncbi:MAG: hypothetical protein LBH60_08795 [Prevotellaceae bacterium]|nr:hypothetical protein [Prevotellaceae bacterium]